MSSIRSAVPRGRLRSVMTYSSVAGAGAGRNLDGSGNHLVDEAIVARLFGGEPAVAVGVGLDLGRRLSGVERHPLLEHPLGVEHLLGLDRDVGRGAADHA